MIEGEGQNGIQTITNESHVLQMNEKKHTEGGRKEKN